MVNIIIIIIELNFSPNFVNTDSPTGPRLIGGLFLAKLAFF